MNRRIQRRLRRKSVIFEKSLVPSVLPARSLDVRNLFRGLGDEMESIGKVYSHAFDNEHRFIIDHILFPVLSQGFVSL
jgi:hypothetical protein